MKTENRNERNGNAGASPDTEWDSIDRELDLSVCWQRSAHVLPRLRVVTELEEFLIPWVHVALVKSDRSFRVIEIHTSLGVSFTIAATTPQKQLYGMLQLERVRCIYPVESVNIKAVASQEE